jgi:hypothetical protein
MNIEYGLFSTKITTEEEHCRADDCFRVFYARIAANARDTQEKNKRKEKKEV